MRSIQCGFLALCMLSASFGMAEEEASALNEEVAVVLTRSDSIPSDVHKATDPYFEGYIQALVDMYYAEYGVIVIVNGHKVWLANLPSNELYAKGIVAFVQDIPGVEAVYVLDDGVPQQDEKWQEAHVRRPKVSGIWFPQMTELFLPLIADPRQATYSVGWRAGDHVIGVQTVGVSLGDDFAIYRWLDLFWGGDLQIGIEAGIWSVFNMNPHPDIAGGTELLNTDFYVGVPITYAAGKWSFRLRGYHISGHLGDEYMVNHPGVKRLNPSIEAIDFFSSYQLNDAIRLYVGPGVYVHSDPSFKWEPMYIEYGTEARFLGQKFYHHKLYG